MSLIYQSVLQIQVELDVSDPLLDLVGLYIVVLPLIQPFIKNNKANYNLFMIKTNPYYVKIIHVLYFFDFNFKQLSAPESPKGSPSTRATKPSRKRILHENKGLPIHEPLSHKQSALVAEAKALAQPIPDVEDLPMLDIGEPIWAPAEDFNVKLPGNR